MIELPKFEDVELLGTEDVAAYLKFHGWERLPGVNAMSSVWLQAQEAISRRGWRAGIDEILLPNRRDSLDYVRRITEAIGTIGFAEERSVESVVHDILMSRSDVIRVRRPKASQEGSIPLADGVTLVDRALEMMTAAASSAAVPRRVVPSRRPLTTQEYMRRVKLGQTEKGSYVITVISPIEKLEVEEPSLFEASEEPFPRRVTRTLARGLAALEFALESVKADGDYRVFEDSVQYGVSANLCEAVSHFVQAPDREASVDINIDWAIRNPVPDVVSRTTFHPDSQVYLAEAAKRFRATEPVEDAILTGVVVRLQRRREQLEGRISVACVVDGTLRQLSVPLGLADYQEAVEAHREQRGVMFRADVVRAGRRYVARNVRDFRVLQ